MEPQKELLFTILGAQEKILNKDLSETRVMLTKFCANIEHSVDRLEAQLVFDVLHGWGDGGFEKYYSHIIFQYKVGGNIAIFLKDPKDPSVIWVDAYSPKFLIKYNTMKMLFLYCALCGAKEVRSTYRESKIKNYLTRCGMGDLGNNTVGVKVDCNLHVRIPEKKG